MFLSSTFSMGPKGMQEERKMKNLQIDSRIITPHALEVGSYPNPGWGTTKKNKKYFQINREWANRMPKIGHAMIPIYRVGSKEQTPIKGRKNPG